MATMDCSLLGTAASNLLDEQGSTSCRRPGASEDRSARRRPGCLGGAGARLVAALVAVSALLLAACGGSRPAGAGLGTVTGHPTPPQLVPRLEKGIAAEQRGQSPEAVADFLAVVKADPKDQVAWYDLGVIAQRAGQDTGAESDYRRALAGDPTYLPALYNLAGLEAPSDPEGAAQLYGKVLEQSPKDAEAELNLGFAMLAMGQKAQGRADLVKAIALDPAMASRVPVADGGTG
ncbi:MAG: tetratricopeptide repeat protein [Acidimicrobiales bacterium]